MKDAFSGADTPQQLTDLLFVKLKGALTIAKGNTGPLN